MTSEEVAIKRSPWRPLARIRGLWIVALTAAALGLLVVGWRQTDATLIVDVDGRRHSVRTHAPTVGEALRQAGFELAPEDLVSPGLSEPLRPGVTIQVRRALPVALSVDGQIRQLRTQAKIVGELLQEAGIQIGPADEIWLNSERVSVDTPLTTAPFISRQVSQRSGTRPTQLSVDLPSGGESPLLVIRRATSLILDDQGITRTLHTMQATVGQVLDEHGVSLFLGDEVIPGLQEPITLGMTVTIHRSMPVTIEVDGRTIRTRTRAQNVAGVLGQEGIALLGKDSVQPEMMASIRPNMKIRVTRVREELAVEFDPIPFETVWVPDPTMEIDSIRLVQNGELGLIKRRFRVVYEDNREVARFLEDTWTAQTPVTKTLAYGTKIVIRTLETPDGPIEYWRKMRVYAVSYTAASSGRSPTHLRYGYTRLGVKATKGIVAVDPSVIPLRTRMYVPGYGFALAADTGGGVKGKLIDLCFDVGKYESWHWWVDIYLLTPVPPASQIRWVLPDYPRFPDRKR
ncbi:MAG: ubiquitin-like domain-containing protein [Anaerolineae bacterium]